MKANRQIKQVCLLVDKLFDSLGVSSQPILSGLVAETFSYFQRRYGTRTACAIQKSVYNDFIHYVLELTVEPSSPIWLKRDKDHLPKLYKPLKSALTKGVDERYILSLLRSYESIKLEPVPDVSSITEPSNGGQNWINDHERSYDKFLRTSQWGRYLRKLYEGSLSDVKYTNSRGYGLHFTSKMGTIGPAMSCAGKEAQCLDTGMVTCIKTMSKYFGKILRPLFDFGFFDIKDYSLDQVIEINRDFYAKVKLPPKCDDPKSYPFTGRVACLSDKGGKTRIVAIGNYWIQESLLSLHKVLYKVLRKIRQDGTYHQESAASAVQIASGSNPVWSYDLTAATDRFPLEPQVQTLKFLSEDVGDSWINLLKGINFEFGGKPIVYRVGQPMGLYGSWATFALTHHCIIQYAAFLVKAKYPFRDYRVLGDDVAIWDPKVAACYFGIINNCLEVQISKQKSITPSSRLPNSESVSAEFAKRIFKNGVEITPVTPNILLDLQRDYISLVNLLDWLARRGYLPQNGAPAGVIHKRLLTGLVSRKKLFYVFGTVHIWELLTRQPLLEGVSEYIPSEVNINLGAILDWRLAKLRKQSRQLEMQIMFADEAEAGQVAEDLGTSPVYGLYYQYIIQQRLNEILDVRTKLSKVAPLSDLEMALRPGFIESDEDPIESVRLTLQEVEYLPLPAVSDFILGKTEFREKKQLRAQYLRSLLDHENIEEEGTPPQDDEPEQTFAYLFQ